MLQCYNVVMLQYYNVTMLCYNISNTSRKHFNRSVRTASRYKLRDVISNTVGIPTAGANGSHPT